MEQHLCVVDVVVVVVVAAAEEFLSNSLVLFLIWLRDKIYDSAIGT